MSAVDTTAGREDGVTLMTLHTAKGLEWPVVVLAGMEDGLFPSGRALESPDGLDEERRLCYVGITRARDALLMTWARARRRGGELRPAMASRFLKELPPELVEEKRTSFAVGGRLGQASWGSSGWGGGRSGSSQGGGTKWRPQYLAAPATVATPKSESGTSRHPSMRRRRATTRTRRAT